MTNWYIDREQVTCRYITAVYMRLLSSTLNRLADLDDEDDEEEDYNLDIEPDDIKAHDTVTVVWALSTVQILER